ncbi:hypothetical protein [Fusibacter tunisiensis]|uniref:Mpv17/PMP22 family protein n=1 Tax=Fusibacter tunisiensis TaxID=1008308 RepID=A0ABS2MR57_9FIRM|nr:hypothetical protein [Fusibacter tunisiensis]MBM7561885.1 hypothetical protein [Fusibacter tunisiensis]
MKKGDLIWGGIFIAFIAFVLYPATHDIFVDATTAHPYIGGFVKFALLATMGELLVVRLKSGTWQKSAGFIWRVIIWGVLGMAITLVFQIYGGGVAKALENGYLIGHKNVFLTAFWTSALMNLFFAPTFMAFHRFTDTYLDLKYGDAIKAPTINQVVKRIDWSGFIGFVVVKTIPLFWIPAHTVTFLLPPEYRILVAALLSMVLGILLTIAKKK